MEKPNILTLIAGSGVGKTTALRWLTESYEMFRMLPSTTTRRRRDSDIENEYRYVTHEEYENLARIAGRLMWDVPAGNAGDRYGTDITDVMTAIVDDEHVYVCGLFPDAAKQLVTKYGSGVVRAVLLKSPGEEVVRERMLGRGDDPVKIEQRITKERHENWEQRAISIPGLHIVTAQDQMQRVTEILDLVAV